MRIILSVLLIIGLFGICSTVAAKDEPNGGSLTPEKFSGPSTNDLVMQHLNSVIERVLAGSTEINTPVSPDNPTSDPIIRVPLDMSPTGIRGQFRPGSVLSCKKISPPAGQSRPRGGCEVYDCQILSPGSDHGGGLYPTKHKFTWRFCEYSA